MRTIDLPTPFEGSERERAANRMSHNFDETGRCWDCDCRVGGLIAEWPCGAEVPREQMTLVGLLGFPESEET